MARDKEKRRVASSAYYAEHPEKWRDRYLAASEDRRINAREYRQKLRRDVLKAYGERCKCCGETVWQFLSIDHINNNGTAHRKQFGLQRPEDMYRWLKKNHWPLGFQILCFNCNLAKGHLGYCPHNGSGQEG